MNSVSSISDVERVLERATDLAALAISSGELTYVDGSANEKSLFSLIKDACSIEGFDPNSAELVSGHKFPDVVFREARIGVELKGHRKGDRILGNSIMGSTPSIENPTAIYLLAWNDFEQRVVWRDYFECVVGAEVTHSPRFVLKPNCSAEESLFGKGTNQIGEASEICLGENGFRSEVILARMRAKALAEGSIPWWVSPAGDEDLFATQEAQKQFSIVKYTSLPADSERQIFLKTLLVGFPELFGKSSTKYDAPLVWSLLRKSVLLSRDAFSAGGQVERMVPTICGATPLKLPKLFDRAKVLFDSTTTINKSDVEDMWQSSGLTDRELVNELRERIQDSGIAAFQKTVVHDHCGCSHITEEDFARQLTNWMTKSFDVHSIA
jgi:hypothetical protein